MAGNPDLDLAIECDVVAEMPVLQGSIDLITVYSGIEHFTDNAAFLRHALRALRPGGFLLAQFPSRYAPFAIANRLLPKRCVDTLLRWSMHDHASKLGFEAFYDRTNYSAFVSIAAQAGFEVAYYLPGYYSSSYAEFLFPLWLISYIYDITRFGLGVRDFASYNLFVLRKPGLDGEDKQPAFYLA